MSSMLEHQTSSKLIMYKKNKRKTQNTIAKRNNKIMKNNLLLNLLCACLFYFNLFKEVFSI